MNSYLKAWREAVKAHWPDPPAAVWRLTRIWQSVPYTPQECLGDQTRMAWHVCRLSTSDDVSRAAATLAWCIQTLRDGEP